MSAIKDNDPDKNDQKAKDHRHTTHDHGDHDHEFDPDKKPPYVTLFLLIAMVLIGIFLVIYFRAW